jgi:transposase-like protein
MNENQDDQNNQQQKIKKRNFSLDEKRNYCMAWKRSTMSQDHFCKTNGISKSALYNWVKAFKKNKEDKENNDHDHDLAFSPAALENPSSLKQAGGIELRLCFQNQMQLNITMPEHRLVSFIQEMSYATAIIR